MPKAPRLGLLLHLLGGMLGLGCLAWVIWRFARTGAWQHMTASAHAQGLLHWVLPASCVYLLGSCALGMGWCCMQAAFLAERPAWRPLFAVYATTQFAKYLPGNIGQYLGRHLWLRRRGLPHAALLMGTLGEAGFLVLAALIWAAPRAAQLWPRLPVKPSPWHVVVLELILLPAGFACLQGLRARYARLRQWLPLERPAWLIPVLPLQSLFFMALAGTLMLLAHGLPSAANDLWQLPSVAAASWLVGFLVIGAPGGLGVREFVLLTLMRGDMPEADILGLAGALRLATFSGDVLFLLLGLALGGLPLVRAAPSGR